MGSALIWYDGSADADRAIRHARALLRETRAVLMHAAERASDAEAAARARALEEGFDPIATVKATRGAQHAVAVAVAAELPQRHR